MASADTEAGAETETGAVTETETGAEHGRALAAGRTDRVRAEPFDAVELPVGALFGDEVE